MRKFTNDNATKKWVEALRSGDYPQTKGTLQDEKGFCCLGVYAKVNRLKGYKNMAIDTRNIYPSDPGYQGRGEIYNFLRKKYDSHGFFYIDELIYMNDKGTPFVQIANFIEKELM